MNTIKEVGVCLLFVFFSGLLHAQSRWSVEFRPGINFPTAKVENIDLEIGFGFEGTAAFRFMPHLAGYAGWGWNTFKSNEPMVGAGSETDFEETGYTFGLQFVHPISKSSVSYLLRAGAIYNHIEMENSAGDIVEDSGHGFGWQVEAGLDIDLGRKWSLRPELRYRSLSRDLIINTTSTNVDLNYLSIGTGISKTFN